MIVRESKDRTTQYLAIATFAFGVLEILYSRGRLVRFFARLQEAGTFLAFASLVLGLILYVRARDKTFPVVLVFCGVLLLLLDMKFIKRL